MEAGKVMIADVAVAVKVPDMLVVFSFSWVIPMMSMLGRTTLPSTCKEKTRDPLVVNQGSRR
jgi:hypothetical protein